MTFDYSASVPSHRLREWWGHHSPTLLMASIGAAIALGLRTGDPSLLSLAASVGLMAFVLLTWLAMRQHDRRLCESCAAAIPLNAGERASRYRRRFQLAHAGSRPLLVAAYLAVLLGSNVLLTVPGGRWGWALIQLSMVYLISAHTTHRRLQPWCPTCSQGGGGSEVGDHSPDLPTPRGNQLV